MHASNVSPPAARPARATRPHRISTLSLALLLACVGAGGSGFAEAQETPAGTTAAATAKDRAAVLSEISRSLRARNVTAAGVDRILANLGQFDMAELEAMAGFKGGAATGSERLVAGSAAAARDRAGELTGRLGGGTTGGGTSASQQGIDRALTPGMRDTSGQRSSCQACPGANDKGHKPPVIGGASYGGIPNSEGVVETWPKTVSGQNGETIKIHKDGSASIQSANGKTEYVNSDNRLVDKSGNAKEPAPDGGGSAGGMTAGDLKRVSALINRHREPTGEDTGSGGPVDTGRTDPTGSRGLYTESRLGAGYVSEAELKEIVRLSVEKLRGPQAR